MGGHITAEAQGSRGSPHVPKRGETQFSENPRLDRLSGLIHGDDHIFHIRHPIAQTVFGGADDESFLADESINPQLIISEKIGAEAAKDLWV